MTVTLDTAITAHAAALREFANAEEALARNDMDKAEREAQLVAELIGTPNASTNKSHSRDSAEKAVGQSPEIVAFRETRVDAQRRYTLAKGALKQAEMRAWLVVNTAGRIEVPA